MTSQGSNLSDELDTISIGSNTGNHMARTVKRWNDVPVGSHPKSSGECKLDAVHDRVDEYVSPGQLYSTESGRMFHAGKILIALVGLPATSKTLLSVAMTRYTRWLGVKTKSFHISEYKKEKGNQKSDHPSTSFANIDGYKFAEELIEAAINDMLTFFKESTGQIAIYDALNIRRKERQQLESTFSKIGVKILFIESIMTDLELIHRNIESAIQSVDYNGWDRQQAIKEYTESLSANQSLYEKISPEENVSYLQYINFGKRLVVNNNTYGYLINKIVFFLMNLREKKGCVYFARCGTSNSDKYMDDEVLNEEGYKYSKALTDVVMNRIEEKNKGKEGHHSILVWTAPRKRTYDSGMYFLAEGIPVRQRSQLKQLNPGVVADLSKEELQKRFPVEYKESLKDPYHFRYPRAESYHDLAVRMEPLLLELERMSDDILIIAHESTLRVLFGYFMACTTVEVPELEFPRDYLVEITFNPFCNTVERIPIKY